MSQKPTTKPAEACSIPYDVEQYEMTFDNNINFDDINSTYFGRDIAVINLKINYNLENFTNSRLTPPLITAELTREGRSSVTPPNWTKLRRLNIYRREMNMYPSLTGCLLLSTFWSGRGCVGVSLCMKFMQWYDCNWKNMNFFMITWQRRIGKWTFLRDIKMTNKNQEVTSATTR